MNALCVSAKNVSINVCISEINSSTKMTVGGGVFRACEDFGGGSTNHSS